MLTEPEPHSLLGSPGSYCLIGYRPDESRVVHGASPKALMLLVRRDATPIVLINPRWKEFVRPEDFEYIEAAILDIRLRMEEYPDEVFRELSALFVGPLVTLDANLGDRRELESICEQLVRL